MAVGRLVALVLDVCDVGLAGLPDGSTRDAIGRIRDGLLEPLRLAVAGRAKAGKSTLVNALVRERIAPTGVGECTKVVTWYRYGYPERVTVEPRDGQAWELALGTDYALPESLGADPTSIARVVVTLSIDALRSTSIIDTPGLASANIEYSAATRELLAIDAASRDAVSDADAVLFLIAQGATREDADALTAIRRTGGGPRASATNTIGVLSKVDLLGDGGDVSVLADTLAAAQASALRSIVSTVVPVVGLLAESAGTGAFTEADARTVIAIAELEPGVRERLLISADRFRSADVPVDAEARARLLDLIGTYGVSRAVEAAESGMRDGTGLASHLNELSGMDRLQGLLEATFTSRADALKADRALLALERISYQPGQPELQAPLSELRNAIEALRIQPEMHVLAELRALQLCLEATAGDIPDALEAELRRLSSGQAVRSRVGLPPAATDVDVVEAAASGAGRWRAFVNDGQANTVASRVADVVAQSYELVWVEASASARGSEVSS